MQPPAVMAFRCRLVTRGYTNVSIKHLFDDVWLVSFREPVFKRLDSGVLTSGDMCHVFK